MPSTALISFQREACLHSLGQSVVGCLRCGHRRACQQYQHSCENRDTTKRPHNFNNKKITNCHNVQLWWEHTAGKQSDVFFYMWKLSYSEIIRSLATVSYLRSVCSDQHIHLHCSHVSEQPYKHRNCAVAKYLLHFTRESHCTFKLYPN